MRRVEVVVVGSGAGGLATALALDGRDVLVVGSGPTGTTGSTPLAQGGIAAALHEADSPAAHARDTATAGAGHTRPEVVEVVTEAAPGAIEWLAGLGMAFDRSDPDDGLALGLEGGHSHRRIVHAGGDRSGWHLARTLAEELTRRGRAEVLPGQAVELLVDPAGGVGGVLVDVGSDLVEVHAAATVLATGGLGGLFRWTTNPPDVRGDGLAMALRAGVATADLELVQFHPTALDTGRDPLPLLTEALRGEGAHLVDADGRRLLEGVHPLADLAPRDVVARAVHAARADGRGAFLDLRLLAAGGHLRDHFPNVAQACHDAGLDPARQPVPVVPAAHYHMGGIRSDASGATSAPGLWAVGEVACTGLHGANRLASNSLLEAVVVGRRAGAAIAARLAGPAGGPAPVTPLRPAADPRPARAGDDAVVARSRELLSHHAGPVRTPRGLQRGAEALAELASDDLGRRATNALAVSRALVAAARARPASLGAHWVVDDPAEEPTTVPSASRLASGARP